MVARFFFDVMDAHGLTSDESGIEFGSPEDMRRAAIVELHDLARDEVGPRDRQTVAVQVRDETGRYVFRAAVSLVAEWIPQGSGR